MDKKKCTEVKDKLEKLAKSIEKVQADKINKSVNKAETVKLASDKVLDFVTFYSMVEEDKNDSSRV